MSLPAADDLFRPTAEPVEVGPPSQPGPRSGAVRAVPDAPDVPEVRTDAGVVTPETAGGEEQRKGASGRIRHDEKMTVYVTSDELMDIERARLDLRGHHGLVVDRGRLVREAVALVLADLAEHGGGSLLVRRLAGE